MTYKLFFYGFLTEIENFLTIISKNSQKSYVSAMLEEGQFLRKKPIHQKTLYFCRNNPKFRFKKKEVVKMYLKKR